MPKVEFQRCVVVDGLAYATIQEAQIALLEDIFRNAENAGAVGWCNGNIAVTILNEKEQILAALTLKDDSRPTARKAFGGKKTRKPKTEELPNIEPKAA